MAQRYSFLLTLLFLIMQDIFRRNLFSISIYCLIIRVMIELNYCWLFEMAGKEYVKEIEKARRDLRALISSNNCAPIMLRLA